MKGNEKGMCAPDWREVEQTRDALSCCGGARPKIISNKVEPKKAKELSSDQSAKLASLYEKAALIPSISEVFKRKPVDSRVMTRTMQTDGEFLETREEKQVRIKCEMDSTNPMGAKRSVKEDVFGDGSILRKELDEKAEANGESVKRIVSEKTTVLSPEREEKQSETMISETEERFTGDLKIMSSLSDDETGEIANVKLVKMLMPSAPKENSLSLNKPKPIACASKFQRETQREAYRDPSSQEALQKISDFTNLLRKLDLGSKLANEENDEVAEAKKSALLALDRLSNSISQREVKKNNQMQLLRMLIEMQRHLVVSLEEANKELSTILGSEKIDIKSVNDVKEIRGELEALLVDNSAKLDRMFEEVGFKLSDSEEGKKLDKDYGDIFMLALGSAMIEESINILGANGNSEEMMKVLQALQERSAQAMIERGHREEEINKRTDAIISVLGALVPSSAIVEKKKK